LCSSPMKDSELASWGGVDRILFHKFDKQIAKFRSSFISFNARQPMCALGADYGYSLKNNVLPRPVAPPVSGSNTMTGFLSFELTANTTQPSIESPDFILPTRAGFGACTDTFGNSVKSDAKAIHCRGSNKESA